MRVKHWSPNVGGCGTHYTLNVTASGTAPNVRVLIAGTTAGSDIVAAGGAARESYTGLNNGPVKVRSIDGITKLIASLRIIYADGSSNPTSYSELMGFPANRLTTTYWFPWYNNVNMDSQLRLANMGSADTTVSVYKGATLLDSYPLAAGAAQSVSFSGVNGGPIRVASSGGVPILTSERIIFWNDGLQANGDTSYFELMGFPGSQLTTDYWIPWYNNVNMDTQLRLANVSSQATTIRVYNGATLIQTFNMGAGQSIRVSFPGVNGGPIHIVGSNTSAPILAAERVIFWEDGVVDGPMTSYSELMAIPNNQLASDYWFPSYSYPDANTWSQLRIANPSTTQSTIAQVYLAGTLLKSYALAPGKSIRADYLGQDSGPLEVKTTDGRPVIVAMRVILTQAGIKTGYSEIAAYPANRLTTTYVFPWYNNLDWDTEMRIGLP